MTAMPSPVRGYLVAFAPASAWLALIFVLSGRVGSWANTALLLARLNRLLGLHLSLHALDQINLACRTMAHLFLYLVLALLLLRGFRSLPESALKPSGRRVWVWVLALVVFWAAVDELHQRMLAERTGRASDVMLDSFGGVLGLVGRRLLERWRRASYVPN